MTKIDNSNTLLILSNENIINIMFITKYNKPKYSNLDELTDLIIRSDKVLLKCIFRYFNDFDKLYGCYRLWNSEYYKLCPHVNKEDNVIRFSGKHVTLTTTYKSSSFPFEVYREWIIRSSDITITNLDYILAFNLVCDFLDKNDICNLRLVTNETVNNEYMLKKQTISEVGHETNTFHLGRTIYCTFHNCCFLLFLA